MQIMNLLAKVKKAFIHKPREKKKVTKVEAPKVFQPVVSTDWGTPDRVAGHFKRRRLNRRRNLLAWYSKRERRYV